jgi:hypothetical protein
LAPVGACILVVISKSSQLVADRPLSLRDRMTGWNECAPMPLTAP